MLRWRTIRGRSALRRALPLALVATVCIRWLLDEADLRICLVGNSETKGAALKVQAQWNLPAAFYVWGEAGEAVESLSSATMLRPPPGHASLPFADGLWVALSQVMAERTCHYILTHDDDLVFRLAPRATRASLQEELQHLLQKYRPAIAGFPWQVGDRRFDGMRELQALYRDAEVAPLTGFDNGMVVYHCDVLPLFFPFAPRGEGGFTGKWTLGAHFLQLFGPLAFREHAIRLNTILYDNTVNMDNIPAGQGVTTIKDGLAYVSSSRHPYEYPLNDAYISFLDSGLHNRALRWGRQMTASDVSPPARRSETGYPPSWILGRINEFYNIHHEALSNTRLIQTTSAALLEDLTAQYRQQLSFRIIMFTKNRLRSFERCWDSVRSALPASSKVTVHVDVRVDFDPSMSNAYRRDYDAYLASIAGDLGPASSIEIMRQGDTLGLRTSILTSWYPASNHEFAIFLEDDIEVSPYFLQYAESMVQVYVYRDHADHRLTSISLYNLRYNEAIESFVSVDNGHQPYIYQQPQSWGAIYLPEPWRRFHHWVDQFPAGQDPVVPDSMTNRWPFANSWKKYYLRFMIELGGYAIYPNLPGGLSYSTNHVESGTNDQAAEDTPERQLLRSKFEVPLVQSAVPVHQPPLNKLQSWTLQHKQVSSADDLTSGSSAAGHFDKCALLLSVDDSGADFRRQLLHLHTLPFVGQILILWKTRELPPHVDQTRWQVPVDVVQSSARWQNRYFPWPQIKYSCIIDMDNDWQIPSEHLKYAVDTWKGHFFDNLVGFAHNGWTHVQTARLPPSFHQGDQFQGYSLLMPPTVYHAKYLRLFQGVLNLLPASAQTLTDPLCGGLLLNCIVANSTTLGPIVINSWANAKHDASNTEVNNECLQGITHVFPDLILRRTNSVFAVQHEFTVPGLHHYIANGG